MPENEPQETVETESTEQKYARLYAQEAQKHPVVATIPQDVTDTLSALRSEIAQLKDQQTPKTQEIGPSEWVQKIRNGDFEGAEKALATKVQEAIAPSLDQVRQRAYQEAVSASQANLEIDRHVQKIRLENPDIVQFEKYLTPAVSQRVEEARSTGKLKTHQDFVRETISAINAEVSELRNIGLVLRGQAKQEANTRNQQVLSTSILTPNQVQSNQNIATDTPASPDVTVESYFTRRRADEARRNLMS